MWIVQVGGARVHLRVQRLLVCVGNECRLKDITIVIILVNRIRSARRGL